MKDKLAVQLATAYNLSHPTLTPLGGIQSTNYKVITKEQSFALHLYDNSEEHAAQLDAMSIWLVHLAANSALPLPVPIKTVSGELKTVLKAAPDKLCSLTLWVEGKTPPLVTAMTDAQLHKVGTVMAELHSFAETFKPPTDFSSYVYDLERFKMRLETLTATLVQNNFDSSALSDFKATADILMDKAAPLLNREAFQLIHGDFHSGNYLIHEDAVRIVDFGLCGFGMFAFDLAVALAEVEPDKQALIVEGYKSARGLPPHFEEGKDIFLSLAYLDNLGLLAEYPNEHEYIIADFSFINNAFRKAINQS